MWLISSKKRLRIWLPVSSNQVSTSDLFKKMLYRFHPFFDIICVFWSYIDTALPILVKVWVSFCHSPLQIFLQVLVPCTRFVNGFLWKVSCSLSSTAISLAKHNTKLLALFFPVRDKKESNISKQGSLRTFLKISATKFVLHKRRLVLSQTE